jgi:formate dehydrogenase assembly factor FdhD
VPLSSLDIEIPVQVLVLQHLFQVEVERPDDIGDLVVGLDEAERIVDRDDPSPAQTDGVTSIQSLSTFSRISAFTGIVSPTLTTVQSPEPSLEAEDCNDT